MNVPPVAAQMITIEEPPGRTERFRHRCSDAHAARALRVCVCVCVWVCVCVCLCLWVIGWGGDWVRVRVGGWVIACVCAL